MKIGGGSSANRKLAEGLWQAMGAEARADQAAERPLTGSSAAIATSSVTPLWRQMSMMVSGGGWSVTKVSIWLRWPMRTGAERVNFIASETRMVRRALAMIACAARTSR